MYFLHLQGEVTMKMVGRHHLKDISVDGRIILKGI
jgi:hypothetical protein